MPVASGWAGVASTGGACSVVGGVTGRTSNMSAKILSCAASAIRIMLCRAAGNSRRTWRMALVLPRAWRFADFFRLPGMVSSVSPSYSVSFLDRTSVRSSPGLPRMMWRLGSSGD